MWRCGVSVVICLVLAGAAQAQPVRCEKAADCDDGNPCTVDACGKNSKCKYSSEPTTTECPDEGNPCTLDRCNGQGECVHPSRSNGRSCDDGLFCNGADECLAGACTVHEGNPCTGGETGDTICAGRCIEALNLCLPGLPGGTSCEDDGNPCTDDRCDDGGACAHVPNTAPCDDGVFCNGADVCDDGACVHAGDPCGSVEGSCGAVCDEKTGTCVEGGAGATCADDGNPCTEDVCDVSGNCRHLPLSGAGCDDGIFCNGADVCQAGACEHAGDPCAGGAECADVCGELARSCLAPVGSPCSGDGIVCTADTCQNGQCVHEPADDRCRTSGCDVGTCAPGAPAANGDGCIVTAVAEGEPCADDGFACTDDTCTDGTCLHVPVASRCAPGEGCVDATCNPAARAADPAGCVVGTVQPEGAVCVEDGEPCTTDQCIGGACVHTAVEEFATCTPVTTAFRQALGLEALARGLMAMVSQVITPSTTGAAGVAGSLMMARLDPLADAVGAVSRTLGGRTGLLVGSSADGFGPTIAQLRASVALDELGKAPRDARRFLRLVRKARRRRHVTQETAAMLRTDGKLLLRGSRALRRELRRLRRISQTFVPGALAERPENP